MSTGNKLILAGLGIALPGVGCGWLLYRTDKSIYGFLMLAFLVIAAIVMSLGVYATEHPGRALPVKKVLVCAGILAAGTVLSGLFGGALVNLGSSGGWTPVGNGLTAFLPLLAGVIVCIWYWQRS